jgi:hypothetical protein
MPGSPEKERLGPRHDDFDDIQTLQNLLELRSSMRKENGSIDESLD